ncbi:MAG TPA: SMP-30/gluconolactonase/LRE family protein [Methylophilus sp.]
MKTILLMLALMSAYGAQAKDVLPTNITGLKSPESVIQDKQGNIYISEINEFDKNGDGQISKVDKKGNITVFAKGLDDPKGLAMIGSTLYVADKSKIWAVDADGKATVFIDAKAFPKKPQFLNDLETDPAGNLYVTDSGDLKSGGAIYKITPDKTLTTIADSKQAEVLAPNGLLFEGRNNLLSVDFASGILYRINLANGAMTELASGFGGGDGIVKTKQGKLYISDWQNGVINQVSASKARLIHSGLTSSADIALSHDGRYLMVPLMKKGELVFLPIEK